MEKIIVNLLRGIKIFFVKLCDELISTCFHETFLENLFVVYCIHIFGRLPMAEQVGCGTPCLLCSLGVREVMGSLPDDIRKVFYSNTDRSSHLI